MTTYLEAERLFLRWSAADSEANLVAAAQRAVEQGLAWDEDEDLAWEIPGPVVLLYTADPGSEVDPENHLVVDLEPGRYRVRATSTGDGRSAMILVQLQPITVTG